MTIPQTISPTSVKRTPAPNTAGMVSPASSIPRYVEPQTMYTVQRATQTWAR